jgi:hypothetical protein
VSSDYLDWDEMHAEFRKALLDCANASADTDLDGALDCLGELQACCLILLNFRERLSSEQQKALAALAATCDFPHGELRDDPDWDDAFTFNHCERTLAEVRAFHAL